MGGDLKEVVVSPARAAKKAHDHQFKYSDDGLLVVHPLIRAMASGRDDAHLWPVDRNDAERWLYVTAFEATVPGQGYGSRSLSALCEVCDRAGATIVLDATAYAEGLSQAQLVAFYARYGFKHMAQLADYLGYPMVRVPH